LPTPDNSPRDRFDPGAPIEEWQATIAAARDEAAKDAGRWLAAAPPVTRSQIAPADINDLLPEAALAATGLARVLRVFPPILHHHAAASGNRYSMRDAIQHPTMPFRKREIPTKRVKIALGILVDCSYSMGGAMPDVRKAALMLYLAGAELDIPVAVWAFSDWQQEPARTAVPFGMSRELAPAYIGGLAAMGGTKMAPALTSVLRVMRARTEERRLLLVIHDGADNVVANKRVLTQEARDIDVIGIYIGQGENIDPLRQLFGPRLVVAPDVRRLSTLLGNLLQRVAGVN
jgi:nitric oxide reductase activation protein